VTGNVDSVLGLRAVVDPYIQPATFVVGNSEEVEVYETPGAPGQLSVVDVGGLLAFCGLTYTAPGGTGAGGGANTATDLGAWPIE
jgi:hypothetical protein